MITHLIILVATYLALFQYLPIFQSSSYQVDYLAQTLRHLILLYLANQLATFIWRQKFVSSAFSLLIACEGALNA